MSLLTDLLPDNHIMHSNRHFAFAPECIRIRMIVQLHNRTLIMIRSGSCCFATRPAELLSFLDLHPCFVIMRLNAASQSKCLCLF